MGFLKGAIEGGAISSTKKLLQAWVDELIIDFGKGDRLDSFSAPSHATTTTVLSAAAAATGVVAGAQAPLADAYHTDRQGASRAHLEWKDAVGLLLLALLILSIFQIGRGLFSIGQGIQEVARSMSDVAVALSGGGGIQVPMGDQ